MQEDEVDLELGYEFIANCLIKFWIISNKEINRIERVKDDPEQIDERGRMGKRKKEEKEMKKLLKNIIIKLSTKMPPYSEFCQIDVHLKNALF